MTDHDIRVKVAQLFGWSEIWTQHDDVRGKVTGPLRIIARVPDYPSGLNAAVAAVEARDHGWQVNTYGAVGTYEAEVIVTLDDGEHEEHNAEADSPARALCLALLKAEGSQK